LTLFNLFRQSPPLLDLNEPLAAILARLTALEEGFRTLQHEHALVTASVDAAVTKVHRELGHVTKRRADLKRLEPCDEPEISGLPLHRSRFSGGRRK